MIERLIRGLAAGSGLTAEEILDVLWLSAIRAGPQAAPAAAAGEPAAPAGPSDDHRPERQAAPPPADLPPARPLGEQEAESIPVRLPSAGPGDGEDPEALPEAGPDEPPGARIPASEVGFGAPRPIRDAAGMPRALRRLRQVRRPGPRLAVDVAATVAATADAGGTLVPVFTRPPERALDLALVVDGSPAMRIWDDTFDEFARLMAQTGAFRSVERWRLIVDGEVSLADVSGKVQPPARLIDPSGRRVVFVATSASAGAWYTPGPWETVASWCAAMPTALIQVLPRQYWAGTALGEPYATARADRPAAPNDEYASRLAWWADDVGGVPLPVVTLAPDALATWAQAAVTGTAWTPAITATPPDPGYGPAETADVRADVLVNDFLSRASPGAERLVQLLAAASTLSMPLIAVLQESLAPDTGVLELAEVLSSGLLAVSGPPSQPRFRFRDDTRQLLQRGMTTFEEWHAYEAVSAYLESRHHLGGPLQALIPDPDGNAELDPSDEPFAALHESLATRLGLRPIPPPEVAGTTSVPVPGPASPAIPTPEALLALLVDEINQLRHDRDANDALTVASFNATTLEVYYVSRDRHGTPVQILAGGLPVTGLEENELFYLQLRPLLRSADGGRALLINQAPHHPEAELAMTVARDILAREYQPQSASAHEFEADIPLAINEAIARSALQHPYQLLALSRQTNGEFWVRPEPLLPAGAVQGDRRSVRVKCQPSDENGTVFAVGSSYHHSIRSGFSYGSYGSDPMLAVSAKVPPGIYDLTAELLGPGLVRFEGLPAEPRQDRRPWPDITATMPEQVDIAGPVHLILVIEADESLFEATRRVSLATELITITESTGAPVTVSVVFYGWQALSGFDAPDDAPLVLAWTADTRQARDALGSPILVTATPAASEIERALALVSGRLSDYESEGRPVLVTIGARTASDDWEGPLNLLKTAHPGIAFGAILGIDRSHALRSWDYPWAELGRVAHATIDDVDVHQFASELGLLASTSTPLPFPLVGDDSVTYEASLAAESAADQASEAPSLLVNTLRNTYRLESGREYRIGRDEGADIPLRDARASWHHAVIRAEGPVWVLEDAGSRNGTFLGNQRVTRLEITGPCVVHFGHPEDGPVMRLELAEAQSPPAVAAYSPLVTAASMPGVLRAPTARIRIQSRIVPIGRHPDNDIVVSDLMVSKRHAELRRSPADRFSVVDLGSHNGTYVNGAKVTQAQLSEGDIIAIGHDTFRLVNGELFEYVDDGRVTFEARELQVAVHDGGKQKILLDGITFPLAERTMTAVIGPPGVGKSTLFNALTGMRPADRGQVRYDSRDLYANFDELSDRLGVVPAESSLANLGSPRPLGRLRRVATAVRQTVTFSQFTVRSALAYAAKLRFASDVSEEERNQRVEEVLDEMSRTGDPATTGSWLFSPALSPRIQDVRDTRIDDLNANQRKRLDICLAQLTRPSVLFIDEPIAAFEADSILALFEEMRTWANPDAERGHSVVIFTSDVYSGLVEVCDRVLVLAPGGTMAYFGPPAEGLRYFRQREWIDLFQLFADQPQRDFAAQFRASSQFVEYVVTPMSGTAR